MVQSESHCARPCNMMAVVGAMIAAVLILLSAPHVDASKLVYGASTYNRTVFVDPSKGFSVELVARIWKANSTLLCTAVATTQDTLCLDLVARGTTATHIRARAWNSTTGALLSTTTVALATRVQSRANFVKANEVEWLKLSVVATHVRPGACRLELYQDGIKLNDGTSSTIISLPTSKQSLHLYSVDDDRRALYGFVDRLRVWEATALNASTVAAYISAPYLQAGPSVQDVHSTACASSSSRGAPIAQKSRRSSVIRLNSSQPFPPQCTYGSNNKIVYPFNPSGGGITCTSSVTSPDTSFVLSFRLFVANTTSASVVLFRYPGSFEVKVMEAASNTVKIGVSTFGPNGFVYSAAYPQNRWVSVAVVSNQHCAKVSERAAYFTVDRVKTSLPDAPTGISSPTFAPLYVVAVTARHFDLRLDDMLLQPFLGSSFEGTNNRAVSAAYRTLSRSLSRSLTRTPKRLTRTRTVASATATDSKTARTPSRTVTATQSPTHSMTTSRSLRPRLCQNGTRASEGFVCTSCDVGFFGPYCDEQCTCLHGTCKSGVTGDGTCSSCHSGWAGPNCGVRCNCRYGTCSSGIAGTGLCQSCWSEGRTLASNCVGCTSTRFGANCSKTCTCDRGTCDNRVDGTGTCTQCQPNWAGPNCTVQCPTCNVGFICSQNIGGSGLCVPDPNYVTPAPPPTSNPVCGHLETVPQPNASCRALSMYPTYENELEKCRRERCTCLGNGNYNQQQNTCTTEGTTTACVSLMCGTLAWGCEIDAARHFLYSEPACVEAAKAFADNRTKAMCMPWACGVSQLCTTAQYEQVCPTVSPTVAPTTPPTYDPTQPPTNEPNGTASPNSTAPTTTPAPPVLTPTPPTPTPTPPQYVVMVLVLDRTVESFDADNFTATISGVLSLDASKVVVLSVVPGSLNVTFRLIIDNPEQKYNELATMINSNHPDLAFLNVLSFSITRVDTLPTGAPSSSDDSDGMGPAVIAGIAIGAVVFIAIASVGIFCGVKKYKADKRREVLEAADKEARSAQKVSASLADLDRQVREELDPEDQAALDNASRPLDFDPMVEQQSQQQQHPQLAEQQQPVEMEQHHQPHEHHHQHHHESNAQDQQHPQSQPQTEQEPQQQQQQQDDAVRIEMDNDAINLDVAEPQPEPEVVEAPAAGEIAEANADELPPPPPAPTADDAVAPSAPTGDDAAAAPVQLDISEDPAATPARDDGTGKKKEHQKSKCTQCGMDWDATEVCGVTGRDHKTMHKEFKAEKKARKASKKAMKDGGGDGNDGNSD
eukprot:PhM_4_TR2482/c1_g1_i2/m.33839